MQQGRKDDSAKCRLELVPPTALLWIGLALTYGASKYHDLPADNWQRVPEGRSRYFGALLRHVFAALAGEHLDAESGLPHLAHAGACILFLLSRLAGDDLDTREGFARETAQAWRCPKFPLDGNHTSR